MPTLLNLSTPSFPPFLHALLALYTYPSQFPPPVSPYSLACGPRLALPSLRKPTHSSPHIPPFSHPILLSVESKLVGTPSLDQLQLLKSDSDDSNHDRDPNGPTPRTTQHHIPEQPDLCVVTVKDIKAARADVQIRSQCQQEEPFLPPW
ncbi:hypothetical protein EI94DRAFT_1807455 [Lactarius quietus]|nr:hypothetical protein EI94DRAFT_1807455 [Lactarius quietus]